jgi:hypothetical protein
MPGKEKPVTVQVDGKPVQFDSQIAACRYFGVTAELFQRRRRDGWTFEEALGAEERDRSHSQNKPITFNHRGKK